MTSPADTILDAFAAGRLIPPLTVGDPSLDEDGAYEIASEIHARRVNGGEQPVGRKIGFTNRSLWAAYGVSAPVWGHVYESTVLYASGDRAQFVAGDLLQPRIEPEIVLHFARTPPVTRDETAILGCIDWIAHGFELVQCPFPDWQFRAPDAIAALTLHGALIVGTPVDVAGIEDCAEKLRTFSISLFRDGEEQAAGGGASVLETPLLAFGHLAEVLAESRSAPVQSGEIVTTGTLTAPQPVAAGETWATTLEGIELPGLAITFT